MTAIATAVTSLQDDPPVIPTPWYFDPCVTSPTLDQGWLVTNTVQVVAGPF